MFSRTMLLTAIGLLILLAGSAGAQEDLQHYVNRYQQVKISRSVHERLARYQHLINYFSSLYYIKPRYRVDADFLKALIIAESYVDSRAQSDKDARGLTQITYPTGKEAAQELVETGFPFRFVTLQRLKNLQPEDLYDPAVNLLIACYLIAKYNHQYAGRIELVVSAWNAGGGSIVNNTPPGYEETLDLIGKVNGYFLALRKQRQLSAGLVSYPPSS
jgi:soluble lytic murein transglycosylase-like protein